MNQKIIDFIAENTRIYSVKEDIIIIDYKDDDNHHKHYYVLDLYSKELRKMVLIQSLKHIVPSARRYADFSLKCSDKLRDYFMHVYFLEMQLGVKGCNDKED